MVENSTTRRTKKEEQRDQMTSSLTTSRRPRSSVQTKEAPEKLEPKEGGQFVVFGRSHFSKAWRDCSEGSELGVVPDDGFPAESDLWRVGESEMEARRDVGVPELGEGRSHLGELDERLRD